MELWYMPGGCKIGRSYTIVGWILWYAEVWVIGFADKSKGLSLSAAPAWSVACARPRSSPSLNPVPCCSSAGYFAAVGGIATRTFLNFRPLCRCRCRCL
jgi:hypothetical protein